MLSEIQNLLREDGAIPALRVIVFALGLFGSFAWLRRLPIPALVFFSAGSFLGLNFWLIQIRAPLGLGTDRVLTDQWAQAGVNAFAEPKGGGFVWGMPAQTSLPATLASIGAPFALVLAVPQIGSLLCFTMLLALPFGSIRNKATAAFAAVMVVAGGAWPGASPYGSFLLRPVRGLVFGAISFGLLSLSRPRKGRPRSRTSVWIAFMALVIAATLDRAWNGGSESTSAEGWLLACAVVLLAPSLRSWLRRWSRSPDAARRIEALALLTAFGGGGLLWWTPPQSLAGFAESRDAGSALRRPLEWIALNVPSSGVILASPAYSAPIAALAGRRVLFPPPAELNSGAALSEPFRRDRLAASALRGRPIQRLAENFSVTHLLLGPGEATPLLGEGSSGDQEPFMNLVLVYQDAEDFRIFRLAKK